MVLYSGFSMNRRQRLEYDCYKRLRWNGAEDLNGMYEWYFEILFPENIAYIQWYARDVVFTSPGVACDDDEEIPPGYDDEEIRLSSWCDPCEEWLQRKRLFRFYNISHYDYSLLC